jgi:hypothetical protein
MLRRRLIERENEAAKINYETGEPLTIPLLL